MTCGPTTQACNKTAIRLTQIEDMLPTRPGKAHQGFSVRSYSDKIPLLFFAKAIFVTNVTGWTARLRQFDETDSLDRSEGNEMTLYMTLGGRKAILAAMPRLQARLETDPCFDANRFRHEFERSEDLTEFLVFLFGGAPFYDGKPIPELLSPLCSCSDVYERFVDHLVTIFSRDTNTPETENDLRQLMERLRPHVLDPKPVTPVLVYSVEPEVLSA
ncbi:hypothetical protein [Roseibium sp.]|uniref:hypothetical protein n=1 Tax=Roseibium sp. TaxID=1936156 RepID=UPI003D11603E